jgi:hypothetical protein
MSHSDPFRYLGPQVENGFIRGPPLPSGCRGVAVIDEQGHESDFQRIYDAGLFAGRLGNGPRQRYRLRARYGECQLEIEEPYRFPPKILISTYLAKERICISTKSWVPIRWCSTAWRAWPLSSLHLRPNG